MKWQPFVFGALFLWLGACLQKAFGGRWAIGGVNPDFTLVFMGCFSLYVSRVGGMVYGFVSGLMYGAIAGDKIAQHITSRVLGGFLGGWVNRLEFQRGMIVAMVTVCLTTLVVRLLMLFISPPSEVMAALFSAFGMSLYNALLALPTFFIFEWVMPRKRR